MVEPLQPQGRAARSRLPEPRREATPLPDAPRRAVTGDRLLLGDAVAGLERTPAKARPTPLTPDGNLDYYRDRHEDFSKRFPEVSPPSYYLTYGDVYVRRFTTVLSPELSKEGQAWLLRARKNLQVAIEAELARNPEIEHDDRAFTDFAYATHGRAYLDAGLTQLPITDLIRVAATPNLSDTLNAKGLAVITETAEVVARDKLAAAMESPAEAAQGVLDAIKTSPDLMRDVVDLLATTDNARTLLDGLVKLKSWPVDVTLTLLDRLWTVTADRMEKALDALRKLPFGDPSRS